MQIPTTSQLQTSTKAKRQQLQTVASTSVLVSIDASQLPHSTVQLQINKHLPRSCHGAIMVSTHAESLHVEHLHPVPLIHATCSTNNRLTTISQTSSSITSIVYSISSIIKAIKPLGLFCLSTSTIDPRCLCLAMPCPSLIHSSRPPGSSFLSFNQPAHTPPSCHIQCQTRTPK